MGSRLESNSNAVRKRIEKHTFDNEEGDEYGASKFGGFPEYFRRKKTKLQNLDVELRSRSTANLPIFKGIVAQVNGYTQPSLNDLHALIVSHGGGFMQYLDGKTTVTHIIASNLTPKKAVEFKRYRIVKPAWVVDSVEAGRLLPWDSYRVVEEGAGQKILGFESGKVVSQAGKQATGYREQTDRSWYTAQLVMSSSDQIGISNKPARIKSAEVQNEDGEGENLAATNERVPVPSIEVSAPQTWEDLPSPVTQQDRIESPAVSIDAESKVELPHAPKGSETALQTPPFTSPPNGGHLEPQDCRNWEELQPKKILPLKRSRNSESCESAKRARLTAEEHNAILLADPRIRKSSVLNPDFLEQYYRESRLHHLSTWKADLKSQLQALTVEKSSSQKQRLKQVQGARRYILHVDFDSFFVAVSLKSYPQYIGKPAVVAHGGGSGSEIASCNYPARSFGVKNGMWMKRAQELCQELKVLPYDFPAYEQASRLFYEAVLAVGGIVQSVSVDEALIDITALCLPAGGTDGRSIREGSIWREQAKADEIALDLRGTIKESTGCAVSVGIGGNILLAKLALRKAKPAGQYQLKPQDVLEFIGRLEVQDLPGIAWSISGKLEQIGVKFVKDIRDCTKEKLATTLGPKTGQKVWDYARGIDLTEVGDGIVRKSVSAEVNWGVRFTTQEEAEEFVENLCGELSRRLLKEGVKGRQLTMKIMRRASDAPLDPPKHLGHGKCDTFNKSLALGVATSAKEILTKEALSILRGYGFSPGELRGIGIQMQKLEPFKGSGTDQLESSQKRLPFKIAGTTKHTALEFEEPQGLQRRLQFRASENTEQTARKGEDPIEDDPVTPTKPASRPPGLAHAIGQESSPSRKPLNTLGTQFILPTQVDPAVLSELPEDIRSKLARQRRLQQDEVNEAVRKRDGLGPGAPTIRDRAHTPAVPYEAFPTTTQIDPESFRALPEDVKAEILATYKKSRKAGAQALLPQSPRKVRTLPPGKKVQPVTRRRGGGLFTRSRGDNTLTQSNFVSSRPRSRPTTPQTDGSETEGQASKEAEISEDFLAALPEDIRREVLDQQSRERLRRHGGIDLSAHRKKRLAPRTQRGQEIVGGQRQLRLPPRPPRPTFSTKKISSLNEVRAAVKQWYEAFRDEGPYNEDVDALVKYLTAVVGEERDMDKAIALARWMAWVLEESERDEGGEGWKRWYDALAIVEDGVQTAISRRGLGKVDL